MKKSKKKSKNFNLTRRQVLKAGLYGGAALLVPFKWTPKASALVPPSSYLDPLTQPKFQIEVPNALAPSFKYPKISLPRRDLYRVGAFQTQQALGLVKPGTTTKLNTKLFAYGSNRWNVTYPGRTFEVQSNRPANVLWTNDLYEIRNRRIRPLNHFLPVDETLHWAYDDMNMRFGTNYTLEKNGVPIVPHVHGGHSESDSDGNPEYWFSPLWKARGPRWVKKTYTYHNDQEAGTIWYHDHSLGITRLNVYSGMAGFYIIRDDKDTGKPDNPFGLPAYPYENALAIQDRSFDAEGQLTLPYTPEEVGEIFDYDDEVIAGLPPITAAAEFFGDHILVNGVIWPKMTVEPRQYRLRLLNGSDSRFYIFKFSNDMPFWQIGTDDGFMRKAVKISQLTMGPGERADIIVDFTGLKGQQIRLINIGPDDPFGGGTPDEDFDLADPETTGRIMQFEVSKDLDESVQRANTFDTNTELRTSEFGIPGTVKRTRQLGLFEGMDEYGRLQPLLGARPTPGDNIRSLGWFEPITENPGLNDIEIWEVFNATGDAHPFHVHLVAFEVLNRQIADIETVVVEQPQHNKKVGIGNEIKNITLGAMRPPEPNERGPKDVVLALPGEVTRIKMKFDRPGRYVHHCHILSHEDHEMMRPYHVGPGA